MTSLSLRASAQSIVFIAFISLSAFAESSHVLVLSGGGTPAGNHYSQYLQTKSLTEGMRGRMGAQSVDVLFAAGHRPDQTPAYADVHKTEKVGGASVDVLLPGVIEGNSPASIAGVSAYLSSRQNADLEKFFLLVSDHGMPNRLDGSGKYLNNCMDLWAFNPSQPGMETFAAHCLSRANLQASLPKKATTVFAMSQCFSGGFHRMSVTTDFNGGRVSANPKVCGFTAATQDLTASGCTPDADGPGYKGYERFFTQQMIGKNFVTGQPLPDGARATVKQAHLAASLEDLTGDIPLSTSDFYLNEWAELVRSKSAKLSIANQDNTDLVLKLESNAKLSETESTQKLAQSKGDVASLDRETFTLKMLQNLSQELPAAKSWIYDLSLEELDQQIEHSEKASEEIEGQYSDIGRERSVLKRDLFIPAWEAMITTTNAVGLNAEELEWEKTVFLPEEKENIWIDSYDHILKEFPFMFIKDPARAKRYSTYMASRSATIEKYLRTLTTNVELSQGLARNQVLMAKVGDLNKLGEDAEKVYRYGRRIKLLRSVLAMQRTLKQVGAAAELADLNGLEKCESTSF